MEGERSHLNFFMGFINDIQRPPLSLPLIFQIFPLKTVTLPSQTIFIQYLISIIKHICIKTINSKRQRSQKPGFVRLIFIFLSCPLFFSFRPEKWKETCLFFEPVPHYGAFQVCSFVWGQPRDVHKQSGAAGGLPILASTPRQSHQPLGRRPCSMNATCFNKCSQSMPRINQQQQLLHRRHQRGQYI